MEQTIQLEDMFVISNLAYFRDNPKIGDIICFRILDDHWNKEGKRSIKRIVAIGGEIVSFDDKGLYVNGKLRIIPSSRNIVEMFENSKEEQFQNDPYKRYERFGYCGIAKPYLVPNNSFFVLGDNVMDSLDSRYYGAISIDTIIGKAIKILWPLKRNRSLNNDGYYDE